jgi:PAS domain S-box-containing protein
MKKRQGMSTPHDGFWSCHDSIVQLEGHNVRVLIVDDHEVVRRGVRSLVETRSDIRVVGEAGDGIDGVEQAKALKPDVVVMDVSMPKMNGLDATREIRRLLPYTKVLILSQHEIGEMVRQALLAGAHGYVVKSAIANQLLAALDNIQRNAPFPAASLPIVAQKSDTEEILKQSAALEEELRNSEERFRVAMSNMAEGLYTVDTKGLLTYINPAAESMLGWSGAELLGKKMHDVTHNKHADGTPFPAADCEGLQVLQKGSDLREHHDVFVRKDGSFLPVVFSASRIKSGDEIKGIVVVFRRQDG